MVNRHVDGVQHCKHYYMFSPTIHRTLHASIYVPYSCPKFLQPAKNPPNGVGFCPCLEKIFLKGEYVVSRVHQDIFQSLRNGPEHATWIHELHHPADRGVVGQDGLVVMRWDFRFMVTGFVTSCVLQAEHFPTGLPRRSERAHAQPGTPAELLAQRRQESPMDELLSICCVPSKSEGLATDQRKMTQRQHGCMERAHGRITASPSCGYRTVRQLKLISAWPSWTPQMFCVHGAYMTIT